MADIFQPVAGQMVRILPPFSEAFPGVYSVAEVVTHEDGQIVCDLLAATGESIGGFDPKFLTAAEE